MLRVVILFALLACFSLNSSGELASITKEKPIRMLFVGNSLTYVNNLPHLVEKVAKEMGVTLKTEMLAFPDYALEDHWNDGKLQQMVASGRYTYVVVQQGPSSQEEGRVMLLEYGAKIKTLCNQYNSHLAFYMVWPARVNYQTFEGVISNYSEAAKQTNSILCPVGKVWKKRFDMTRDFSYYGPDQFHPSIDGSKVAATVIFDSLFK